MAKASKPVSISSKHITKQEIEARQEAEDKLKGSDNLVYEAPTDLVKAEKEGYLFLVGELKESGILNNLDIELLKLTANTIVGMRQARVNIRKHGQLITRANGDLAKNPAITILKDYEGIFRNCCRELALSPSARANLARLTTESNEQQQDELLKILSE